LQSPATTVTLVDLENDATSPSSTRKTFLGCLSVLSLHKDLPPHTDLERGGPTAFPQTDRSSRWPKLTLPLCGKGNASHPVENPVSLAPLSTVSVRDRMRAADEAYVFGEALSPISLAAIRGERRGSRELSGVGEDEVVEEKSCSAFIGNADT